MSRLNKLLSAISMSPILWGIGATCFFYAPIRSGQWTDPMVVRYFAGHWADWIATALFFVGMATVLFRILGVSSQRHLIYQPLLDAIPQGGQAVDTCELLLRRLDDQPASTQNSYLVRRLRDALEFVYRKNTADTLDDQLRHLAAVDAARLPSGYSFLRTVIGAIPIVGVLGTVVGMTAAVSGLAPQTIEETLPTVMTGVGTAFDVTALSLALSVVLLFAMRESQRLESKLVAEVDARVDAELVGRFQPSVDLAADPQVEIIRRLAEQMLRSTDQLVARQAELWNANFVEAQKQWANWSAGATVQMQEGLTAGLSQSLKDYAAVLVAGETAAAGHWSEVQQALLQNAEAVTLQQRELVRQGEVLTQVVNAAGQVEKLETELNRNLSTLAGAKNFEQTVLSLGAAIQLLNAKLGHIPTPEVPKVELKSKRSSKAA